MLLNHDSHSGKRSGTTSCHKRLQKESQTLFFAAQGSSSLSTNPVFLVSHHFPIILLPSLFFFLFFFLHYRTILVFLQVLRLPSLLEQPMANIPLFIFDLQGRWRGGRGCSRRCHGESSLRSRDLLTNLTFLPPSQPCAKLRRTEARLKSSHCC